MYRRVAGVLVCTLVLAAPVAAARQGSAPKSAIGIALREVPVRLKDDPRARVYIIDHISAGDVIRRKIEVSSGLDRATTLQLYAAGAEIRDGAFSFFEGRTQNELAGWTRVRPSSIAISPGGAEPATVTIVVPADATDGERYGVVWAESPPQMSTGGIGSASRVGIRIYLSVGEGDAPTSDFSIDSLRALREATGRPVIAASVHNTGERALDMSGKLLLTNGPGNLRAGPFPVKLGTTLGSGQTELVTVLLDPAIPNGPWDARLSLRSGLLERSASARITFPRRAGTAASPVPAQDRGGAWRPFGVPIGIWVVIVCLVLALIVFTLYRRRRRREGRVVGT